MKPHVKMFRSVVITLCFNWVLPASIPIKKCPLGIICGSTTTIEQHPYQLSIEANDLFQCGASLYKNNVALTAAHCVYDMESSVLRVRAGSSQSTSGGKTLAVKKMIVHKDYSSETLHADIALLILEDGFQYSEKIQPIVLPNSSPAPGTEVMVTGWGDTEGPIPASLQEVVVKIVDTKECERIHAKTGFHFKTVICTWIPGVNKGPCHGDSGGPLNIGATQVGIVSWGDPFCNDAKYPVAYTDVSKYVSWIKTMTS